MRLDDAHYGKIIPSCFSGRCTAFEERASQEDTNKSGKVISVGDSTSGEKMHTLFLEALKVVE